MKPVHGFEFLEEFALPEHHARGLWYRHVNTGAEVFHVANDDPENLFAFAFKTLPSDSTGVAHILEHTVLCGSRKFPVKDPFIRLVQGSLNTFVNAMTYPDKTVYPAASTVEQDLFNILQVYGDAVFFPLLKQEFFKQEGHRVQYNEQGNLELTGIVYNEMKGNYSNHDSIVGRSVHRYLLPDTPYGHDSGGDPSNIPDLSYEDFLGFHRTYYHPSNARIFLYGDIPTERYLDFLHKQFLSHFDMLDASFAIPRQPRWAEPREQVISCSADGEEGTTSITVSWLLDTAIDPESILSCEMLSYILLGSSAGPLRKRLIESGLGDDLSAATGMETELYERIFSVGIRGTRAEKKQAVVDFILNALSEISRDGIDEELVEASLRKVEFRNREIKGGMPNGLRLMDRALRGWLHGAPPDTTVRFERPFEALRAQIKPGSRYFERMIEQHLLSNTHQLVTVVRPDETLREREKAAVDARLSQLASGMTSEDEQSLRDDQAALELLQVTPDPPEAVNSLPFLRMSDLPKELERIPTAESAVAGTPLYLHDVFSNGIYYLDLSFDISGLDPADLLHVPLFVEAIGELGLPGRSYDEVVTEIGLKTGGFSSSTEVALPLHEVRNADRRILFRVKMLEKTLAEAIDLVRELLLHTSFDNHRRLDDLVKELRSSMSGSVIPSGHHYAAVRAGRAFSDADRYEELWQGSSQLLFLHELKSTPVADIAHRLSDLGKQIFRRGNLALNLTAPQEMSERALPVLERLVGSLPEGGWSIRTDSVTATDLPAVEALIVPADVNYVAQAMPGARLGEAEHIHEQVLAHILRTGPLWESIRMRGGAYGATATARGMDAVFSFWSYRDPQINATLAAFKSAVEEIARNGVEPAVLERAIIGVTGRYIRPLSPAGKGIVAFRRTLYGIDDELREQNYRTLHRTTGKQLQAATARLVEAFDHATIAVVGGAAAIESASRTIPGLREHQTHLPV